MKDDIGTSIKCQPPAVFFALGAVKKDPALQSRGDRKILVTTIYAAKEQLAEDAHWSHQASSGLCPVLLMRDTESAVFTQKAKQTRHCHKAGTEIYVLLAGEMTIEVEGTNYSLGPGDMIVVLPGAYHEIQRDGEFLCRVFTVNCGGIGDRYEIQNQ